MTTPGSQAVQDVTTAALKVVAAFRNDPVREQLHPVHIACLDDLEAACRFLYELTSQTPPRR